MTHAAEGRRESSPDRSAGWCGRGFRPHLRFSSSLGTTFVTDLCRRPWHSGCLTLRNAKVPVWFSGLRVPSRNHNFRAQRLCGPRSSARWRLPRRGARVHGSVWRLWWRWAPSPREARGPRPHTAAVRLLSLWSVCSGHRMRRSPAAPGLLCQLLVCTVYPCTPAYVHTHTCTSAHLHTLIPAYPHTCTPSHLRSRTPALPHTCTSAHLHTCTPAHLRTCTRAHLRTRTSAHPHTCTPAHPHTCAPAHLRRCPALSKPDPHSRVGGEAPSGCSVRQ